MSLSPLLSALKDAYIDYFEGRIEDCDISNGFPSLEIRPGKILALCQKLKQDPKLRFNFLSDLCGVDYLPREPRFEVIYHLYSIQYKYRLRLKCKLGEGQEIDSVTPVWKTANWHEREAYDMYGVTFIGHPDLRRIYLWEGFEGFPQRKDFPLRGYKDEYNPYGLERRTEERDPGAEP